LVGFPGLPTLTILANGEGSTNITISREEPIGVILVTVNPIGVRFLESLTKLKAKLMNVLQVFIGGINPTKLDELEDIVSAREEGFDFGVVHALILTCRLGISRLGAKKVDDVTC
jgi:hypothetical protein